jgi:predicted esterase
MGVFVWLNAMATESEFTEFRNDVFALYHRGEFQQALDAVLAARPLFPEERNSLVFWQACFHALLAAPGQALSDLQEGLAAGEWWHPNMLQNDSDLASLQELGEFREILATCARRHAEAQKTVSPERIAFPPPAPHAPPYPVLLALHGMGSRASFDAQEWLPAADLGWLVALPQSSQLFSPGRFHWTDAALAEQELHGHWQALQEAGIARPDSLVLGGFSQGGARALDFALRQVFPCRGVIAVVPGRLPLDGFDDHTGSARAAGLKVYLVAGRQDPRLDFFEELHAWLTAHGLPCGVEWHPQMGHTFPGDMAATLTAALDFIAGHPQPGDAA